MSRTPARLSLVLAVLLLATTACGSDGITDRGPSPDPNCAGATQTCATWTAANGPHELRASVTLDVLTVEAGAVVYAAAGVQVSANQLRVNGTADQPVRFLPLEAGGSWGGLVAGHPQAAASHIRHTRIERAAEAIRVTGRVTIEDVRIEHVAGHALSIQSADADVRRVHIEGATGTGMQIGGETDVRVDGVVIRASGAGIRVGDRSVLLIRNAVIEDNAGDGIATSFSDQVGGTVVFEGPVRITRNDGYPLRVPLISLRGLSTDAAQSELLGNTRDTVFAYGGVTWGQHRVPAGQLSFTDKLPVRAYLICRTGLPPIQLQAGAVLVLETPQCTTFEDERNTFPTINATPESPVTVIGNGAGLTLAGWDPVAVRYLRMSGVNVSAFGPVVTMQDVELRATSVSLLAPGSTLARAWIMDAPAGRPAVTMGSNARVEHVVIERAGGDALRLDGTQIGISDCTIRNSAGHGIHVQQGSIIRIERCNLEENAGSGVHNATFNVVDARDNWWGDPEGPLAPDGDGIGEHIEFEPFRAAPYAVPDVSLPNRSTQHRMTGA